MHQQRVNLALTGAVLLGLALNSAPVIAAKAGCAGRDGGTGLVTAIDGGETLVLEDGRAVRLIGVLGPKRARRGPASEARLRMEEALAELTLGKRIALHLDERLRDRYGRVLAQVMVVTKDQAPLWVQEELVRAGLARVISFKDNRLCIQSLLAAEEKARRAADGLWASGFFAIRPANAEDLLFRLENSYEIVEGEVSKVAELKGRTYINFGRNWRRDFTAFIPEKSARLLHQDESGTLSSGGSLTNLRGKQIRVRGWLKNYNGPSITVTHPEQIEIVGERAAMAP